MQRVANIPRFALHVRNASRRNRCQTDPQLCTKPQRKSVFVLKAINPVRHPELDGKYDQDLENGDIEAQSVQLGIFDSVEAAEENIKLALKVQADRLEKQPEWAESKYICFELAVEIDHGVYNSITYKVRDGALVEWKRGIKDIFNGTSMNSKLVKGAK